MTYIAGIRRRDRVFLVADSAMTQDGTWPRTGNEQVTTSFGESQIFESDRTVQESALKIHHLGNMAIAVAGDARQANEFVAHVREQLDRGVLPRQAISNTAAVFVARLDLSCQAIATIVEQPRPSLLSFNLARRMLVRHEEQEFTVQTGAQTLFEAELYARVLGLLDSRLPPDDPEAYLVSAVAWLQSMGVRSALISRGIGGAFYGVYAHEHGISWQPDVVFGLHHRLSSPAVPVITIVRDNVLLLRSGVDEASRALWSSTSARITIPEWYGRWRSFDDAVVGSKFRFVVLIDTVDWRVAVFEIAADGSSKYVRCEGPTKRPTDTRLQMLVDFAPEVRAHLSQPLRPAASPLGVRICFAWSPSHGDPRIVSCDVTRT